ncbi:hypothetical protein M9H77_26618 [Catharanthus roseus]|uniref:Uncharacterized protein n=1 Tax=Catharanthus roseus TaxID=4058 RepID=A0ACC0ABR0_CATRO|nr:hypothetical protein M9H77_26618 [Catharanthus roseus]
MHFPSLTEGDIQTRISEGFSSWFREEMKNPVNASSSECLKNLSWEVPLVNVPFQEDVDIDETSRIDVDVQDIGTLIHESGKLESVKIRGRNSIGNEDDNNKDEEEMVRGSKKKRAHPEMSTAPATTSTSPASASIPPGMSASLAMTSTPLASASIPPGHLLLQRP